MEKWDAKWLFRLGIDLLWVVLALGLLALGFGVLIDLTPCPKGWDGLGCALGKAYIGFPLIVLGAIFFVPATLALMAIKIFGKCNK